MPIVTFLPDNVTVEVPQGSLISEAAIRGGIEDLHLPCAGKGTCGRCLVEIVAGETEIISCSHLDDALATAHLVLSCQTKVRGDITVRVRTSHDAAMQVVGDTHLLINEEYLPDKAHLSPQYRTEMFSVPPASIDEHYSDWQRLVREITRDKGERVTVRTHLAMLRKLAESLRAEDGRVTVLLQESDGLLDVLDIHAGRMPFLGTGLAIDIGTTTVAVQLVSLHDGQILANRTSYNAQIRRGADVISRIDYARTPERQAEMRELVLETLNELITGMLDHAGVPADAVHAVFLAANTVMVHLLLGMPARHIREAPYVPTVNPVPMLTAAEVGLALNPQAMVAIAPGVGSYVGGDITAGLLCTDLPRHHDDVFLFMDIGTNGEIVLGNADWMLTCACSAGPAFEGSGIKCGMRATTGAIEYVDITPGGSAVTYDVIGGGKAAGICGSGLISLLGELLVRGIIDQSGRFNTELTTDRLIKLDNRYGFVLEWGAHTENGENLVITEADIENLMRTKAAIYAACALILKNVGLDWSAISRVIIAGGFGRYIQIEDAILIGLLPDLPPQQFTYIGNSSLTGAYLALLSRERREELAQIAGKMTYIDLSSDPTYMDSYMSALFLPHTEMGQFPTVAKRLAANK